MTTKHIERRAMIAETYRSILAALAELQNRLNRVPVDVLGDLHNVDEQLWNILDLCDEAEKDR